MTRRQLCLSLLRDAGPRGVTTGEFLDGGVGSRYSARVRELRQQGHPITSERIREGSWRYTLNDADVGGGGESKGGEEAVAPSPGPAVSAKSMYATADVGATQLFPDDDAWLALRAKDVA